MRRRRLLGALSASLAATSGCLSRIETPSLQNERSRPSLAREDFVSEDGVARRDAVVPNVSLLPVSTAAGDPGDGRRAAPSPGGDDSTTSDETETTTSDETETTTSDETETTTSDETETTTSDESGPTTSDESEPTTSDDGARTDADDSSAPSVAVETAAGASDRNDDGRGLYVTDEFWRYRTHVHRYAVNEVTTTVFPTEPATDTPVKVVVAASVYPRGAIVDTASSDAFRPASSAERVTVPMDLSAAPEDVPLQYTTAVVPETLDPAAVTADDLHALMETDPFVVADGRIERVDDARAFDAASGEAFEREPVEGGYVQTIRGRTNGRSWAVSYLAFQSAYDAASRRSRGRARAEYVSFELLEGAANEIASFLDEAAENNGFTDAFERIQFALSFVQRLPYVADDVSTGYDDYTKFIMETLTSLKGDCEDTSILFASILESEPFNYDAVLLEPPGHMGVGLLMQKGFDGFAYKHDGNRYYYVETTTEGWGVGQIPDQYRDEKATIYDV